MSPLCGKNCFVTSGTAVLKVANWAKFSESFNKQRWLLLEVLAELSGTAGTLGDIGSRTTAGGSSRRNSFPPRHLCDASSGTRGERPSFSAPAITKPIMTTGRQQQAERGQLANAGEVTIRSWAA